jgi:hypothetical protein
MHEVIAERPPASRPPVWLSLLLRSVGRSMRGCGIDFTEWTGGRDLKRWKAELAGGLICRRLPEYECPSTEGERASERQLRDPGSKRVD